MKEMDFPVHQKAISMKERQAGKVGQDEQNRHSLFTQPRQWVVKLKDAYDDCEQYKQSGRLFSGSDPEISNIGNQKIRSADESLYSIGCNYVYIISKALDGKMFYKIGQGGNGVEKNRKETKSAGRLGDAQTFLAPGISDSVGYKVHFLVFYGKYQKHLYKTDDFLNVTVEERIHEILRYEFKSAVINFANENASEWYIVPANEDTFFFGFVFDIVASFDRKEYHPLEIWKILPNRPKEVITIKPGWLERIGREPEYNHFIEEERPPFTARIDYNNFEDKGTVELFRKELHMYFEARTNRALTFLGNPFVIKKIHYNTLSQALGQPLRPHQIYVNVECKKLNFGSQEDIAQFRTLGVVLHPDWSNVPPVEERQTRSAAYFNSFDIHIGDFLEMVFKSLNRAYDAWPLKSNYLYYKSQKTGNNIVDVVYGLNSRVPRWFFHFNTQIYWANKFCFKDQYKFHTDYALDDTEKKRWKCLLFFPDDLNRPKSLFIQRMEVNVDDSEKDEPLIEKDVPIVRIMQLMAVNEPDLGIHKNESHIVPQKSIEIPSLGKVVAGDFLELREDFWKILGETTLTWYTYLVKRVYKRTDHVPEMDTWFEVQLYPPKSDNRIFLFPAYDVEANAHKIRKTTRPMVAEEAIPPQPFKEPNFRKGDIVRAIPAECDGTALSSFGEEHTEKTRFHYVCIDKCLPDVYVVKYYPPWNLYHTWYPGNTRKQMTKKYPIGDMDRLATKIDLQNEDDEYDFDMYKKSLQGEYPVDYIYDHLPKNDIVVDHDSFIQYAHNHRSKPVYFIKWEGYELKEFESKTDAKDIFNTASIKVNEYWRHTQKKTPVPVRQSRRNRTDLEHVSKNVSNVLNVSNVSNNSVAKMTSNEKSGKTQKVQKKRKNVTRNAPKKMVKRRNVLKGGRALEIFQHSIRFDESVISAQTVNAVLRQIKNDGKGDCLFKSFAHIFFHDVSKHPGIRRAVWEYYKSFDVAKEYSLNSVEFKIKEALIGNFPDDDDDDNDVPHHKIIGKPGIYANVTDIYVIANIYNVNVFLVQNREGAKENYWPEETRRIMPILNPESTEYCYLRHFSKHFEALEEY